MTGASGGIGSAIIIEFAKAKYNVVVNYNTNEESARDVLEKAQQHGVKGIVAKADVRDKAEVQGMIESVMKEFRRIDVLVNCAGITRDKTFIKMTQEMWDEVIDTNIHGVFNVTKQVVPIMVDQHDGAIINISSVVGLQGNYGQTNYAATKAGLIGFTKSLAKELASHGVTVNAIAPGFVDTPMTKVIPEKVMERIIETIPLKRMGRPEEIAETAVFLARGKYITGQVISVNGGMM